MKSLRKSILTLLALTLFGGAGAWAQGQTIVWGDGTDNIVLSDPYTANNITFTKNSGSITSSGRLAGGFSFTSENGNFSRIEMTLTSNYNYTTWSNADGWTVDPNTAVWEGDANEVVIPICTTYVRQITFVRAEAAIELTKTGANQWTLGQAPDYDLELQVEYYEAHALKNIPAGWQVMVNGDDKTSAIVGDSLLITETDSVTLVPPAGNLRRVKSVTLEDEGPATVLVESITLNKTLDTVAVGSTKTLSVTSVLPENATDQTYTWSSDNTDVATVGATTGEVTAVGVGTANITATANDGSGVSATCAVTVTPEYYNKLTKINDNFMDQLFLLKQLGRGLQAYNSSLTAAQAYALATYQASIDGRPVYVIMSSQVDGYEIHYAVSTDASATEHTADLYNICNDSNPVRMYYIAQ